MTGAAFTPSAQTLRIQSLSLRKKKKIDPEFNPIGKDGKLCYPPKRYKFMENPAKKEVANEIIPGIVNLEDLLNGEYMRKQKEKEILQKKVEKMRRKVKKVEINYIPKQKNDLAKLQAVLPKNPDKQKQILLKLAEEDMRILLNEENIKRYLYYLNIDITNEHLSPYDKKYIQSVLKKLPVKYKFLKKYQSIIADHKTEIVDLYFQFMRKNLLHYILKDPKERKRVNILRLPRDYPRLVIRAPVPWHNAYCIGQQLLEMHYYIDNVVVTEIRKLWENNYSKMFIIPTDILENAGKFPLSMQTLEDYIDEICTKSRYILEKQWLSACADIFLKYKTDWKKYVPRLKTDSPVRIRRFFQCVNILLSLQLRQLVMKSLKKLLVFFSKFKVR